MKCGLDVLQTSILNLEDLFVFFEDMQKLLSPSTRHQLCVEMVSCDVAVDTQKHSRLCNMSSDLVVGRINSGPISIFVNIN